MKFQTFFAKFKQISLRRKLVRSELGKNLLTAADAALDSDEPWKVGELEDVIDHAPIPAYERGAISGIIASRTKQKAAEIYHESFAKYMFGNMALEDVRLNARSLGKHERDKAEAKKVKPVPQTTQPTYTAQQAQFEAWVKMREQNARMQAMQNSYKFPQMFASISEHVNSTYDAQDKLHSDFRDR